MTQADDRNIVEEVRLELESARVSFHALLNSLSENDARRQSLNPGWTNGEIIAHMLFGFILANALAPMARLWGRLPKSSSRPFAWLRVGKLFDSVYEALLKKAASIKKEEWQRGMYYPAKWDPNFSEFMTLEKIFHYPVIHFNSHLKQISH